MTFATLENETMPMRVPSGTLSMNVRAAAFAASERDGSTSRARIEPDVSMQMTTVPSLAGTRMKKCGPASASKSAAAPAAYVPSSTAAGHRDGRSASSAKARFE